MTSLKEPVEPPDGASESRKSVSEFFTRASTVWEDNYTGKAHDYRVHFFAQRLRWSLLWLLLRHLSFELNFVPCFRQCVVVEFDPEVGVVWDNDGQVCLAEDSGAALQQTRAQLDALVLGLPWRRLGAAGVIAVL